MQNYIVSTEPVDFDPFAKTPSDSPSGYVVSSEPVDFDPFAKTASTKPPGVWSDIKNTLSTGFQGLALDAREVARRAFGEKFVSAVDKIDEWTHGKSSEDLIKGNIEKAQQSLTPEMRAAMQKTWWNDETDSMGDAWSDPRAYLGNVMQSLPGTAVTTFPALGIARGIYTAQIAAKVAPKIAAARAATAAQLAGGLLEGLQQAGQTGREVREEILALDESRLADSAVLNSLMDSGLSFDEARAKLAEDASAKAMTIAGVVTGIFGGMGDRVLAKAFTKGLAGNLAIRVAKGATAEGLLEEFPQSYLSRVGANIGMQEAQPATPTTKGALNEGLGGLVAGGIMGGGFAALSKRSQDEQQAAPSTIPPTPAPQPPLPISIDQSVAKITSQKPDVKDMISTVMSAPNVDASIQSAEAIVAQPSNLSAEVNRAVAEGFGADIRLPEITTGPRTQEQELWVAGQLAQRANQQKEAELNALQRESWLPKALYDAKQADTLAQKSGALDITPTAMEVAAEKAVAGRDPAGMTDTELDLASRLTRSEDRRNVLNAEIQKRATQAPTAAPGAVQPAPEQAAAPSQAVQTPQYERYQWMRNKEGGQDYGNQQIVRPLTEADFNRHLKGQMRKGFPDNYADYIKKFPDVGISFISNDRGKSWKLSGINAIENLRPESKPEGWVKPVASFESPEAIAHGKTADSEVQPAGSGETAPVAAPTGQAPVPGAQPLTPPAAIKGSPANVSHETLRPLVESLIKRRTAARQVGKERVLTNAIDRAKSVLAGATVGHNAFRLAAKAMQADPVSANALTEIARILKQPVAVKATPVAETATPETVPQNVQAKPLKTEEKQGNAAGGMSALKDPNIAALVRGMKSGIGADDRGGRVIVDMEGQNRAPGMGDVLGRTVWTGHPWWFQRPDQGLSAQQARRTIEKAVVGEKLGAREQRFMDYVLSIAAEQNDTILEAEKQPGIDTLSKPEQEAAIMAGMAGVKPTAQNVDDIDLLARLAETDPDTFERLAIQYENRSDEEFRAAVQEAYDAHLGRNETQDQGGARAGEAPSGAQAATQEVAPPAPTAQPAKPRFGSGAVETLSEAESELRALANKTESPGDVLLGNMQYAPFDDVVRLAREGIESGAIRPFPAQLTFKLDIAMRDADRVLEAALKPAAKPPETPPQAGVSVSARPDLVQAEAEITDAQRTNYARQQEIMRSLPGNVGKAKQEGRLSKNQLAMLDEMDRLGKELPQTSPAWTALMAEGRAAHDKTLEKWRADRIADAHKRIEDAGFAAGQRVKLYRPPIFLGAPATNYEGVIRVSKNGNVSVRTGQGAFDLFRNPWEAVESNQPALTLTSETPAEVRTREAKEKAAAEAKAREEAKPTGPNVRADQTDLFNTQGGFDFRNATPADHLREAARKLDEAANQDRAPITDDDRDHFTLERGTPDNTLEKVTFSRGEYITYRIGEGGKQAFGEIDGISHARSEFSVDGLWYPFGFAYKAEKPAAAEKPTVPLSSAIEATNKKNGADLNYADRIHTPTVHADLFARIIDGEVSADEFRASFEALLKNKEAVIAELSGMTKAAIFQRHPGLEYRYKNDTKADVVDAAFRDMASDFVLGESYSFGMGRDSQMNGIRAVVNRATDQTLADYAQAVKDAREERAASRKEVEAGMDDPQTIDDFQRLMAARAREIGGTVTYQQVRMTLTPEQRERFDILAAEKSREERGTRREDDRTRVSAAGATTGAEIIATKHTRDGYDLFVVKAAERVERDVYNAWNAAAKKLGGWYSAFKGNGAIPGFQFKTREGAEAFQKYVSAGDTNAVQEQAKARRNEFADDRSQTAVERLTEMADSLDGKADASLGQERNANTDKRARQAASAEAAANSDKAMAQTMRNIAVAIKNGTAKFLDRVRQRVQVETLRDFMHTAQNEKLRALYPSYVEQQRHEGEKPNAETADYVTFPSYTAFRSDLASLGRALLETDGTKKIGQRIMKVADDVSDAYLKFAKENIDKVSTFRTKSGQRAAFPSKAMAEASIKHSGYKGAAIVLPVKRNENLIILSPSEAIKRGVWDGDNDKRITLVPDLGAEIVEKLTRAKSHSTREISPWQFNSAHDKRKRLAGMGIETPAELRAAVREFIGLREAPKETDKIKEMERAMIGRRNDGMDFFPTPANIADEMVETAGIQEGMSVLEPSAGMGHIAERIRAAGVDPDVVELSNERKELLEAKGFRVIGRDFMDINPREFFTFGDTFRAPDGAEGVMRGLGGLGSNRVRIEESDGSTTYHDRDDLTPVSKNGSDSGYDRILMNPPFGDRRDAAHVQHAYELLKPGGRLVSIMGEGVFFGSDKKAQAFRDWLEKVGATDEKLDEGTFLDPSLPVNTGVNARMVVIDKPGPAFQPAKETDTGTAMFSRADSILAPVTRLAGFWQRYAERDDAFRYKRTEAKDAETIGMDYDAKAAGFTVKQSESAVPLRDVPGEFDYVPRVQIFAENINGNEEEFAATHAYPGTTDAVFIRINDMVHFPRDKDGALAYQMVMTWAVNNDFRVLPDTDLIAVNRLRRTEATISMMLKYREKAGRIYPHREQFVGLLSDADYASISHNGIESEQAIPAEITKKLDVLKNRYWSDPAIEKTDAAKRERFYTNLENLLVASQRLAERRVPEIKNLRFADGYFENTRTGDKQRDGSESPLVGSLGVDTRPDQSGVGPSTLRRASITRSLLRQAVSGESDIRAKVAQHQRPESAQRGDILPARLAGPLDDRAAQAALAALGPEALYSRDQAPEMGLSVSTVESLQNELGLAIGKTKAGKIRVVQKWGDLPQPLSRQVFSKSAYDVQAIYDEGRVWMVAENIAPGRALAVAMHDVGVHQGAREFLGDENFKRLISQLKLWSQMRTDSEEVRLAKKARQRIPENTSQAMRDEELFGYFVEEAVLAGHGEQKPSGQGQIQRWFNRLWEAVKSALVKLGIAPENLTVDEVVALARGSLERALAGGKVEAGSAYAAASVTDQTQTEAFKRWFKDSKAVDSTGKPLVVYHGTNADFSAFDPNAAPISYESDRGKFFFTNSKDAAGAYAEDTGGIGSTTGANVMPTYLALRNPLIHEGNGNASAIWDSEGAYIESTAKNKGHDGIIVRGDNDSALYIAFRPEQIKSAIGNNGQFDANNPDIRFSRAGVVAGNIVASIPQPAKDYLSRLTDTLLYNYVDNFRDLRKKVGEVKAFKPVPENMDPGLQQELYSGRVLAKTDDFHDDMVNPMLKAIHDAKLKYEQVEEYLLARHAPSRNAAMREINPTAPELEAMRAEQEAIRDELTDNEDVQAFIRARRELREAQAEVEDGIADESAVERIQSNLSTIQKVQEVRDYRNAVDRLRALRNITPYDGDNTALSGMSDTQANAVIEKAMEDGTADALERISAMVDAITSQTRRIYAESGLEKPETIAAWEAKYEHYVPLHRDEVGEGLPAVGQGFNIRGRESKRATGSEREVTNILAHVVAQHDAAVIRAEKVKVDRALFDFIKANPDPIWSLDTAEMTRTVDPVSGVVVERVNPTYKNKPNVLTLKIDGDEHTITFDERSPEAVRIAAAMKNLSAQELGEVTVLVGKFTRLLATMNTSANPVFVARNFLRDLQTAYVNLSDTELAGMKKQIFKDVPNAIRGFWSMARGDLTGEWAKHAREFRDAGGMVGWMEHYKDIGERADKLKTLLADMGAGKGKFAKRAAFAYWNLIEDANAAVENGVRLAAYVNARRSGMTSAKAASLAKNLTVNFNRKGAKGVELNMWYMFMNASIQGTSRLVKALGNKNVRKIIGYVIASGFLLDMLARALAGDGDDDGENDYDQLPEHVKSHNYVFWVGGRPVTIPMPYGYNFFASVGRKMSEAMFRPHYSPGRSALDLMNVAFNAFSPTGQSGSFLQLVAPTIADPFVQWAENKNFAGNPLRREQLPFGPPKPEYQMGFKSNSAPAKWLAELLNDLSGGNEVRPGFINLNPAGFDFAVTSVAGGAGRTYLQMISLPIKGVAGDDIRAREVPFANIFLSAKPEYQTERKFYENIRGVELAREELQHYRGDPAKLQQIRESHGAELRMAGAARIYSSQIANLRKRARLLEKNEPEGWKDQVRAIEERKRALMSDYNKRYVQAMQ